MKLDKIFEELKLVAEQMGVAVRLETGKFSGGNCILFDKKLILINKNIPVESRVTVLARSLAQFPLENIFLKPIVREYIERERKRLPRAEEQF